MATLYFHKIFLKVYQMSQIEALTQCLVLALTAPNDQKAQQAAELAEQIAQGLTKQVNQCKQAAIKLWGSE
jgi:hypothetical protein